MGYSDTKFFGENIRTRAITICMDISPSMVAKGVTQDVLAEATKMLENMNAGTKFNVVIFVDGAEAFAPQMVYATQETRPWPRMAQAALDGRRQGNCAATPAPPPTGIKMAVEMGSDTVFVLPTIPPTSRAATSITAWKSHPQMTSRNTSNPSNPPRQVVRFYPFLYKHFENDPAISPSPYYYGHRPRHRRRSASSTRITLSEIGSFLCLSSEPVEGSRSVSRHVIRTSPAPPAAAPASSNANNPTRNLFVFCACHPEPVEGSRKSPAGPLYGTAPDASILCLALALRPVMGHTDRNA
jgi:hypothetical protein